MGPCAKRPLNSFPQKGQHLCAGYISCSIEMSMKSVIASMNGGQNVSEELTTIIIRIQELVNIYKDRIILIQAKKTKVKLSFYFYCTNFDYFPTGPSV